MALRDYLGEQRLGVLASYQPGGTVHHVVLVYPRRNDGLQVFIPQGHALAIDSLVTVHLDNRSGVDAFDAELRVYRASYKGRVIADGPAVEILSGGWYFATEVARVLDL
ncbi:MAG: hypothetical protein ACTS5I_00695, partial [Rhodanobacter sp.]